MRRLNKVENWCTAQWMFIYTPLVIIRGKKRFRQKPNSKVRCKKSELANKMAASGQYSLSKFKTDPRFVVCHLVYCFSSTTNNPWNFSCNHKIVQFMQTLPKSGFSDSGPNRFPHIPFILSHMVIKIQSNFGGSQNFPVIPLTLLKAW